MSDRGKCQTYGRKTLGWQKHHQKKVLQAYLSGGGSIADFARIHRLPVARVRGML